MRKKILNRHTLLSLVATCAALTSCTTSEDISPNIEPMVGDSELTCEAKGKVFEDLGSRSSLTLGAGRMDFKWNAGDAITVFAKGDNDAVQKYRLKDGANEPKATFNADNFGLQANKFYYAFSKPNDEDNVKITDYNNIVVDYKGQTQISNGSTEHLGDYDFQAAGVLCKDPNHLHFAFNSLGATLRVIFMFKSIVLEEGEERKALFLTADDDLHGLRMVRFTEMELWDKQNTFRQTHRNFSFVTGTTTTDGVDSYSAAWPTQNIEKMDRFKLHLNSSPEHPLEGGIPRFTLFNDGSSLTNNSGQLIAYIEVPPHSFTYSPGTPATHNPLNFILKGYYEKKDDVGNWVKVPVSYVYEVPETFGVAAGNAYQIAFTVKKPEEFDVTLNINHNWQHGDVVDNTTAAKSRATGDPGNDKNIYLPNHLYYIYCHDGKVVKPSDAVGAEAVTHITTTAANWSTEYDEETHNYISTYIYKDNGNDNDVIKLKKYKSTDIAGHVAHVGDCTRHLYVVASNAELSLSASLGDSEESVVRELKYNIPGSNAQVFMRDLYSTPWDATNFEGDLNANQDITLYHVAALVDVKWNSSSAINSVSVNNVKNENLYLFKPTENTGGILTAPNGYTETKLISDEDDKYLGREVFYLPQFKNDCQYSIGLNSDKQTVTFTPDVTNGYTSWLRWLKKK